MIGYTNMNFDMRQSRAPQNENSMYYDPEKGMYVFTNDPVTGKPSGSADNQTILQEDIPREIKKQKRTIFIIAAALIGGYFLTR